MSWQIYLSGEIHSDWRDQLQNACIQANLDVEFSAPVTNHQLSDDCGVTILGEEANDFWKDRKGAQMNAARNQVNLNKADLVIVRFGEKYRQWNAAFDAGYAHALNKPLIVVHPSEFNHALKEVDAAAQIVANTMEQVLEALKYLIQAK